MNTTVIECQFSIILWYCKQLCVDVPDVQTKASNDICYFPYDEVDNTYLHKPVRNDYWCWDEGGRQTCKTFSNETRDCVDRGEVNIYVFMLLYV